MSDMLSPMLRCPRWWMTVVFAALIFAGSISNCRADGFTSADLLAQSNEVQENFIGISLTMAAAIAAQSKPEIARCLNDWYFAEKAHRGERIDYVRRAMRKHSKYHPSSILVAVIEKVCGSF